MPESKENYGKMKCLLILAMVILIAASTLAMPAAAVAHYVPRCNNCGSANLVYVRTNKYYAGDQLIYAENEYVCSNCGKTSYFDLSIFD